MRLKIAAGFTVCLVALALSGPSHTQDAVKLKSKTATMICYGEELCRPGGKSDNRPIPHPRPTGCGLFSWTAEQCLAISRSSPPPSKKEGSDDPFQTCDWHKLICDAGTCLYQSLKCDVRYTFKE
jgi:hypothetical protein